MPVFFMNVSLEYADLLIYCNINVFFLICYMCVNSTFFREGGSNQSNYIVIASVNGIDMALRLATNSLSNGYTIL